MSNNDSNGAGGQPPRTLPRDFKTPLTCFFWHRYRNCNKGDRCEYAHYETGVVASAPVRYNDYEPVTAGRNAITALEAAGRRAYTLQQQANHNAAVEAALRERERAVTAHERDLSSREAALTARQIELTRQHAELQVQQTEIQRSQAELQRLWAQQHGSGPGGPGGPGRGRGRGGNRN